MSVTTSSWVGPKTNCRSCRSCRRKQQSGPYSDQPMGFLPQFGGLDRRHQDLQRSGPVHFLADDRLHLAQHAQAHWQPAVDARGDAPDQAGTQHELVAQHFGLGRSLLGGVDRILGKSHAMNVSGLFAGNPSRCTYTGPVRWLDAVQVGPYHVGTMDDQESAVLTRPPPACHLPAAQPADDGLPVFRLLRDRRRDRREFRARRHGGVRGHCCSTGSTAGWRA